MIVWFLKCRSFIDILKNKLFLLAGELKLKSHLYLIVRARTGLSLRCRFGTNGVKRGAGARSFLKTRLLLGVKVALIKENARTGARDREATANDERSKARNIISRVFFSTICLQKPKVTARLTLHASHSPERDAA
jgi:hypothetical protein